MSIVIKLLFLALFATPVFANESCECFRSSCAPCEIETGTTFYTEKCGVNGGRVKSCKRPTCIAVENQKQCLAQLSGAPIKAALQIENEPEPKNLPTLAAEAGEILDVTGDVQVTHASGVVEKPRKREVAYVGDQFETKSSGRAKVRLRDGSEMSIAGDSRLKIEKVDVDPIALKRQIALRILAGRVRNKVQKEYKDENYFEVKTRSAVAGVRGTDFITSYLPKDGRMVSEIRTLEGLVRLQSTGAIKAKIDIPAGTFAAVIAAEDESIKAEKTQLSPLYKIHESDLQRLKVEEFLASKPDTTFSRTFASTELPICNDPVGYFNQCSYTCINNPKGESRCRVDLPGVACVRRLCRANGRWEDPRAQSNRCTGTEPTVQTCDDYW